MKRLLPGLLAVLLAASCDRGDWFGPLERAAREAMLAWDMWATDSVRPYEQPMPAVPEGVVPAGGRIGFDEARDEWRSLTGAQRVERGAVAYKRFCRHCHGPAGDGRVIVGESFHPKVPDLRTDAVQAKSNAELYEQVSSGTDIMIPLDDTMTPLEIMLAVDHVRRLQNAASEPYFRPSSTEPIE